MALSIVAALLSTLLVYAAFVFASVTASMFNGEGIACRDAECGAVADLLESTSPWLLIAVVILAVAAGLAVGRMVCPRRHERGGTTTGSTTILLR